MEGNDKGNGLMLTVLVIQKPPKGIFFFSKGLSIANRTPKTMHRLGRIYIWLCPGYGKLRDSGFTGGGSGEAVEVRLAG